MALGSQECFCCILSPCSEPGCDVHPPSDTVLIRIWFHQWPTVDSQLYYKLLKILMFSSSTSKLSHIVAQTAIMVLASHAGW